MAKWLENTTEPSEKMLLWLYLRNSIASVELDFFELRSLCRIAEHPLRRGNLVEKGRQRHELLFRDAAVNR
jgi:hypothetical protein